MNTLRVQFGPEICGLTELAGSAEQGGPMS